MARAVAAQRPPKYERPAAVTSFAPFEAQVKALLVEHPELPATVPAERVGWSGSITWFRDNVRRLRLSIRLLALTGLRFGELAALRVGRIDLARQRLTISESVTEVGGRLVFSSPKTHQSRTVPVPSSVIPALAAACEGRAADELLLTSPRGGPVRIGNWRRRVFDPACQRAGITGVTPHDLRHTAASLAAPRARTSRRCSGCWATPRRR